jgi:hypothetical protein
MFSGMGRRLDSGWIYGLERYHFGSDSLSCSGSAMSRIILYGRCCRVAGVIFLSERSFGEQECREWEDLLQRREEVVLNTTPDTVTWVLERSGKFTTASI